MVGALIGIGVVIVLIVLVGGVSSFVLAPFINYCGPYITNWVSIPVVNTVIIWGQAVAVVVAIAVRVFVGLRDGVFQNGSPKMASLGEYAFRSVTVIALVGLMPVLCNLVMMFGQAMMRDVAGLASEATLIDIAQPEWDILDIGFSAVAFGPLNTLLSYVPALLGSGAAMVLTVKVMYQLFKRQVEMLIVAVAAPWVSIKSAMESDSNAVGEYLVNLFGMCAMQWIQYLFLLIGLAMLNSIIGGHSIVGLALEGADGWVNFMLTIAVFGAAQGAPQLLDRWTFLGGSSRGGSMMAGMVIRGGLSSLGSIGRSIGGGKPTP